MAQGQLYKAQIGQCLLAQEPAPALYRKPGKGAAHVTSELIPSWSKVSAMIWLDPTGARFSLTKCPF